MKRQAKIAFFGFICSLISAKTGINYPDLEPGNEFWNWVRVPAYQRFLLLCYKSLWSSVVTRQNFRWEKIIHRHWCHLENTLQTYCEQVNCHNFYICNSHHQHAAWLFQTAYYQDSMISCSFSTTAGLLVKIPQILEQ